MSHALTIEVPDDIYEPLKRTASKNGQSSEVLVTHWISTVIQQLTNDPLEQFIGALRSQDSDWADHLDQYVGKALADTMQTKTPENALLTGGESCLFLENVAGSVSFCRAHLKIFSGCSHNVYSRSWRDDSHARRTRKRLIRVN